MYIWWFLTPSPSLQPAPGTIDKFQTMSPDDIERIIKAAMANPVRSIRCQHMLSKSSYQNSFHTLPICVTHHFLRGTLPIRKRHEIITPWPKKNG